MGIKLKFTRAMPSTQAGRTDLKWWGFPRGTTQVNNLLRIENTAQVT